MVECRNAALTNLRKGELSLQEAHQVNRDLEKLELPTIPSNSLLSEAFAIAMELRHSIYDCIYVATTIATDRLLVTADQRFAAKVAASEIGYRITLLETFAARR